MNTNLPPFYRFIKTYFGSKRHSERLILNKLKEISTIHLDLNDKYKISIEEHTFNPDTNPFFYQPPTESLTPQTYMHSHFVSLYREIGYKPVINPWLMMFYVIIGNPLRAATIGQYEIYSFSQFCDKLREYKKNGMTYVDVGHRSLGMGHVRVLRMDVENGGLFIQDDGGSNGYERMAYWEQYHNQKVAIDEHITWEKFVQLAYEQDEFSW